MSKLNACSTVVTRHAAFISCYTVNIVHYPNVFIHHNVKTIFGFLHFVMFQRTSRPVMITEGIFKNCILQFFHTVDLASFFISSFSFSFNSPEMKPIPIWNRAADLCRAFFS